MAFKISFLFLVIFLGLIAGAKVFEAEGAILI